MGFHCLFLGTLVLVGWDWGSVKARLSCRCPWLSLFLFLGQDMRYCVLLRCGIIGGLYDKPGRD